MASSSTVQHFSPPIETDGILRFVQASLKQGLYLNGVYFRYDQTLSLLDKGAEQRR